MKLTGESVNARHVTTYDTEFGFVQAWPDRLIIGRHTADQFGYKDAQKQRLDARTGPTPTLPDEKDTGQQPADAKHPVLHIDPAKHSTKPV